MRHRHQLAGGARTSLSGPLAAAVAAALLGIGIHPARSQEPQVVRVPQIDLGEEELDLRAWAQRRSAAGNGAFDGFRFEDRVAASGIRFQHRIVADSAQLYRPNHYDHGSGVAAADVDGDGLPDLYFVSQLGRNELWRNAGGGRFEDLTEEAGVGLEERVSVTASFADVDNDGDPDLFVTTVGMGNVLFENDGQGRFRDVTEEAGVGYTGHSSGAVFFDYDRDGWLDLFLTNVGVYTTDRSGPGGYHMGLGDAFDGHLYPERTEYSVLYRNLGGGRFADVSAEVGLRDGSWSGDATFADLNGDGFPDLYVLNMQGDDHYYENRRGQAFVDRTAELFPRTPWGTMGVKFFDRDNDGLLDLILTDMHSDMSRPVSPGFEKLKSMMTWEEEHLQGSENNVFGNAFYRNLGEGRFREVSDEVGVENYWPWGLSVGDLNADGYQDVFIASSMNFPYRYGINSALLNDGGKMFRDSEFPLGIEPRADGRTKKHWFDLDCAEDSWHVMCRGRREARFTVMASVGSRSSVILDLDGDGDLDIVTNEFNDRPQVLVSDLSDRRSVRFLKVRLVGTESNRDGLGAMVRVRAGSETYTQQHDGKSGYLSHSSLPLYFGLGEASKVDAVEVLWPSGRRQTVRRGIPVNAVMEIVEE